MIKIGKILKPQGINGELKIEPLTDNPTRFKKLKTVIIEGTRYEVLSSRVASDAVFLSLVGVDRTVAETFRQKFVEVERAEAVKLPPDRNFIVDVIGCKVVSEDTEFGIISDVLQNGAADVYVVTKDKADFMFPALKKVILSVDVDKKIVTVDRSALLEVAVYED